MNNENNDRFIDEILNIPSPFIDRNDPHINDILSRINPHVMSENR